ncbi:MAG: DUF885 domain-containing protein, partial [Candidatus Eremiobacteraeota bacterium]|nr:DUF885 domain-containing protein [Candidatus Eremiobacteraeota bacterium]
MMLRAAVTACALVLASAAAASAAPARSIALQALAARYYDATFEANPLSADDAGVHRFGGRLPDYSAEAQSTYMTRLRGFRTELNALAPGGESVHDQVDYLLLRSDLEGDWWQRTYLKDLQHNPATYEGACSNGIFNVLKRHYASNKVRAAHAIARLRACRAVLETGKKNLTDPVREFGKVASEDISGSGALFGPSLETLVPGLSVVDRAALYAARDDARSALAAYKAWIDGHLSGWKSGGFAVGAEQYDFFLRRVLLLPYTGRELQAMAAFELARDRALEAWEANRSAFEPAGRAQPAFHTKVQFLAYYEDQTRRLRAFLAARKIVTVPAYIGHFKIVELPKALAASYPGGFMNPPGAFDGDPAGFYFVPDFNPKNTSFFAAQARQSVLPVLGHEGLPGHFLQFSIANHNADRLRRVHSDGVFSEGWAFYSEEMLMRAGLYDADPAARRAVIHLMRHRATRVGVDVRLATGAMTMPQAIAYFTAGAGIDRATAEGEGTRFAMGPGQAIDYLTGKLQIEQLLGDYRKRYGNDASLLGFHDTLLSFGTVPFSTIA